MCSRDQVGPYMISRTPVSYVCIISHLQYSTDLDCSSLRCSSRQRVQYRQGLCQARCRQPGATIFPDTWDPSDSRTAYSRNFSRLVITYRNDQQSVIFICCLSFGVQYIWSGETWKRISFWDKHLQCLSTSSLSITRSAHHVIPPRH